MIVTERLGATVLIDDLMMRDAGHWIVDRTKEQVRRELMAFAAARAIDVDPRAIRIRLEPDYHRAATRFEAVWSPSTEGGVELLGGPSDGLVIGVAEDPRGWPRSSIVVMPPEASFVGDLYATAPSAAALELRPVLYDIHGINDRTSRWVYRLAGG